MQPPDRDTFLARVRELLPRIRERAGEAEALRRLPDQTFKELKEAGLLRGFQPRRFGGAELDPLTNYEAVMEVASACPSTGWFLGVVGVHAWQLALFPEQAQHDVWGGDSGAQISSSYAPTGHVEPVAGGFRLRGRWSFSSGCDHCDWVFLGGVAGRDGGVPDARTFLLPRADYEIDDTWHVAGLSGTGSKDIVVDGALVPEHRTHRFLDGFELRSPGQALNDGPLYRLPFGCVFSYCIAVPAAGAAAGALALYREQMRAKRSAYDRSRASEDPFAQVRLAEAAAEIDAARAEVRAVWEPLFALAQAGEPYPLELRARARLTAANVVKRGVRAVDALFEASGGRALFLDNPMQRFFRDVHAMRGHAFNNPDKAARLFGHAALHPGEPPLEIFL